MSKRVFNNLKLAIKMSASAKIRENQYCKSLKYSGNNKIAIIALRPYALL